MRIAAAVSERGGLVSKLAHMYKGNSSMCTSTICFSSFRRNVVTKKISCRNWDVRKYTAQYYPRKNTTNTSPKTCSRVELSYKLCGLAFKKLNHKKHS